MNITWYGAASILIEAAGERILFDPFVQLKGGENPNSLEDFISEKYICITHGHLDHLMETAEFLDKETPGEATVYCGSVAANTLEEQGNDCSNVVLVKQGMRWKLGEVTVRVYRAKHSAAGMLYALRTLCSVRMLRYPLNALFLWAANRQFPEKDETYLYEVCAEGKCVQIMGSLGLDPDEKYSVGADLLLLPFQGTTALEEKALAVVEKLQPRRVMLHHFDDAFPPVSRSVDTRAFKKLMDQKYPQIPVVKPAVKKTVTI